MAMETTPIFDRLTVQAKALQEGEMRIAGTGRISIADNLNVLLQNPVDSGVKLSVFGLISFTDITEATYPDLHTNPTNNLPTTARTIFDTNISTSNTPNVTLYADDMASGLGGSDEVLEFAIEGGRTEHRTFVAIPPGGSLGITNPFSGLTSADTAFTAWFMEKPV